MENKQDKTIFFYLSIEEKEKFFDSFDTVQTDCDGVLWTLHGFIIDVQFALRALRNSGKRVLYVSNNSVRTMKDSRAKLEGLADHAVTEDDITYPAKTISWFLREIKFDALCYNIGSANFKDCLRAGFQILDGPNEPITESAKDAIAVINDIQPVKAVIVDFDYNVNNIKLLRAQMYLQKGALFITGVTDELLSVGSEMRYIGPGCYVEILQRVTGRNPIVLAKPGLPLNDALKKMFSIENPRRVLFVGDRSEIDIKFGHISNYQTLLVGTGRYK
uniref:4-nitrophenylphosphatase n=1 Tax=Anopheles gambiae TaxID=7165 RepID=A0A1S4H2M3_ANOGA